MNSGGKLRFGKCASTWHLADYFKSSTFSPCSVISIFKVAFSHHALFLLPNLIEC